MQEIIVYRNPLEARVWEMVMDGSFFPIIVGVIVFFAVFLLIQIQIVQRFIPRFHVKKQNYGTYAALLVAAIAGVWTVKYMAI